MPSARNILRSAGAVIIPFASRFRGDHPAWSMATQARIASALRQMYRNLADLPVPDRFTSLLARPKKKRP